MSGKYIKGQDDVQPAELRRNVVCVDTKTTGHRIIYRTLDRLLRVVPS